jgi:hypothetical protein
MDLVALLNVSATFSHSTVCLQKFIYRVYVCVCVCECYTVIISLKIYQKYLKKIKNRSPTHSENARYNLSIKNNVSIRNGKYICIQFWRFTFIIWGIFVENSLLFPVISTHHNIVTYEKQHHSLTQVIHQQQSKCMYRRTPLSQTRWD